MFAFNLIFSFNNTITISIKIINFYYDFPCIVVLVSNIAIKFGRWPLWKVHSPTLTIILLNSL